MSGFKQSPFPNATTRFAYAIAYAIAYASLRRPYATRHGQIDPHIAPNTFRLHLIKYLTRGFIELAIYAVALARKHKIVDGLDHKFICVKS